MTTPVPTGKAMKLTKTNMEALAECAQYADRKAPYWWRRKSMEKLLSAGLVEVVRFGSNPRANEHAPTPAGRLALADIAP